MAGQNTNQNPTQNPNETLITTGIVGLFHTISGTKTKIVYTNLFTGEIKVKSGGFFFNFPWRKKAIKVNLDQQKIDTSEKQAFTLGGTAPNGAVQVGPQVSYDTDYYVRVVNPEKFMDSAYAGSASQILKTIGDILDQKVQDYIKTQQYDTLIAHNSVDFLNQIGNRALTGAFPANSLNQQLLDTYGVEVTKITFQVKPPQQLVEAAAKTRQAVEDQKRIKIEQETERMRIETEADRIKKLSDARAQETREVGKAKAEVLGDTASALGQTLDPTATKDVMVADAFANGSNKGIMTIGGSGTQQTMDVAALGQIIGQTIANALPTQQQAGQQLQAGQQQQPQQPFDWASLPDTEYLTAEDSAALAAERGKGIQPGARYHISYLTADEKKRYCVAADKGKTR